LPCFIYISIATTDLPDSFPWQVWVVALIFPGAFAVAVYYVTHWLSTTHRMLAAPLSLSASYGNVGYFGIPMTIALLGSQAAIPAAIVHLLHNLIFLVGYPILRGNTANSAHAAQGNTIQRLSQEILSRAILNPVTISTILGVVVVAFNVPVPELVTDSLELLAATAIPLTLFSVGIAMHPALASIRSGGLSLSMVLSGIGVKNIIFPLGSFALVR